MSNYKVHYSRKEYREEYLNSSEWREKSKYILSRDPICKICDKNKSQDSHHLTYKNLPFEKLDTDLIGICRKCHNRIHKYYELSGIDNLKKLKSLFFKSKKIITLTENFIKNIPISSINRLREIYSILRIDFRKPLENLNGKKISFFQFEKIKKIINSSFKDDKIREKHSRVKMNKSTKLIEQRNLENTISVFKKHKKHQ